jgi:hypothetical protein
MVTLAPIALPKETAATAVGLGSVDSFDRYVAPHVKCVRRGRLRLYPVTELQRWVDENAEFLFAEME